MRIYEYALGGNTIFFDTHPSPCTNKCHRNRYRCRAYVAEEDSSEEVERKSGPEQVKESKHYRSGDWKPASDVSLELLLTCREFYNEAVLVPFTANEFGLLSDWFVRDGRVKILFLRDLIPDQSRAISTLHIRGRVRCGFVQQHVKALSGLKTLKVSFDWNMATDRESSDVLMDVLARRFDASGLGMLATANLQTVDITVDLTVFSPNMQAVMAQKDELVDWLEGKRALLLAKQSPVARTRRAGTVPSQPSRISKRIQAQREKAETSIE